MSHEFGQLPRYRYYSSDYRSTSHVHGGPALSRAAGRAGKICLGARKRPLWAIFSVFELQRKFDFCDKILQFSASWNRTLAWHRAFVTNSFCDLTLPIESLDPRNLQKNPGLPNEFADLEQFELEHPETTKTIFATNPANHPGTGITLRTTALPVT